MKKRILAISATLALVFGAGAVTAKPALRDQPQITEGIIAVGIAYEVSEKCSSISARRLRGINYLFSLKGIASDLGYSDAEIEAFIDDKAEERRLEGIARARLASMGAVAGNEASYCAVGQAEIAKDSAIGRLLR